MTTEALVSELVPIDSLSGFPNNPRRGDVDAIIKSLKAFGQTRPIIVQRSTGYIVGGNHVWQAAKLLGWDHINAVYLDLDDTTARRVVVADNQIAARGENDHDALAAFLQELASRDALDDALGFTSKDLDAYLRGPEEGADEIPDVPEHPWVLPGQMFSLGRHRLLCGDSTRREDVARVMDGSLARLVVTDPPYGVGYDGGTKVRERLAGDTDTDLYRQAMPLLPAEDRASLYLFASMTRIAEVFGSIGDWHLRNVLIWNKDQAQFGALTAKYHDKYEPIIYATRGGRMVWHGPTNEVTVWDVPRARRNDLHPTQKPVELIARAVRNSSQRGDTVFDGFGGSGSTLAACEGLDRDCRTIELNPGFAQVIIERWERLTGGKHEVIG